MKQTTKTRSERTTSKTRAAGATRKATLATLTEVAAEMNVVHADPRHDEIAKIAYFIYRHRIANAIPGDQLSDWLTAEAEVLDQSEVALAG